MRKASARTAKVHERGPAGRLLSYVAAPLLALALIAPAATTAQAQAYPSRPITLIVPFAPGAVIDTIARTAAAYLSARLNQTVTVENRSGASGNAGIQAVAKAAPDGYTLGVASFGVLIINPYVFKPMPFDIDRDLIPVATIGSFPQLLTVNSKFPAKSLQEFIALAKSKPRELNFGSAGVGSALHVAMHQFSYMAGVELTHVPYRGAAPALIDLLAERIQVMALGLQPIQGYLRSGALRVLATGTATRMQQLPDVPTAAEAGLPGYEPNNWAGVLAPKGTPPEIVRRLSEILMEMPADPSSKKMMSDTFIEPLSKGSEDFTRLIQDERKRWDEILRASNLKMD